MCVPLKILAATWLLHRSSCRDRHGRESAPAAAVSKSYVDALTARGNIDDVADGVVAEMQHTLINLHRGPEP